MHSPLDLADTESELDYARLAPEELAAALLFFRQRGGFTSARRLAQLAKLPLQSVETALCRGLSTLVQRGHSQAQLCEVFTLTPEQLERAAKASAFGKGFKPVGICRGTPSSVTRAAGVPQAVAAAPAAVVGEPAPFDETALLAELAMRLREEESRAMPAVCAAEG